MTTCSRLCLVAGLILTALVNIQTSSGQAKPKDLQWTHAFDLACRKLGEAEFSPSTQKFGIEALRDLNTGLGLYVTEKGAIALGVGFAELKLPLAAKGPTWITGLDLPARKAGEKEFTKQTKVHSMEIFRDPNTENYLYITSDGTLAATATGGKTAAGNKTPQWVHSVDLNVRKGGVKDWKEASKIGLEIYRDQNTGNLVFISQTGSIAVVPEKGETKASSKAPAWLHGLDLSVRKATEPAFTPSTKKYGIEVFADEATSSLIFICETGSLAVLPGKSNVAAPTEKVKEPAWSHGWNVKARKFGEKDFSERTTVFGGEVFRDDNTGAILYISETGSISVAAAKKE